VLRLVDLVKRYGDSVVVDGVSLTIAPGERVVLLGGSGSGKTTTLKMVNRLLEPDAGRVEIDGTDAANVAPHELRRRIGYCFQQVGLLPHLTIGENVGITPRLLGWDRDRIAARVDELLTMIELDPAAFRDRRPASLSGGQQQRVGVARALAAGPKIVLLDEPFGALDPLTRDRLQQSFLAIARQLALTVVFVTHDVLEALCVADRIAVMRAGRIEQVGTAAELLARPATAYVQALLTTPLRQADALRAMANSGPVPAPGAS
jgi:osmoprotectant transport system ATP-binding protein